MTLSSIGLARRLEAAEAESGAECARAHRRLHPESCAAVLEAGGGSAIFIGAGSPLSHAAGLGMSGPVSPEDLDRLEEFYGERGAPVSIELCPLADPSLVELLAERGYRITEFNNVLVRPLAATEALHPEPCVRPAEEDEQDLWAFTVGRGFLEKDELTGEEMDVGRNIFQMAGVRCYFGFNGSQPAAAAAMLTHGGVATLFADSTITPARRAGLHAALIRGRLRWAIENWCDLATASTQPGSTSQRNFERNGFQVAYTRATLVL